MPALQYRNKLPAYFCLWLICIYYNKFIRCFQSQTVTEKFFYSELIFSIIVCSKFEVWVLGEVVFIRQKRSDSTQLQDTFASIEHRQFINGSEVFATMSSDEFKNWQKNNPSRLREGSYTLNTNTINTVYKSINYLKQ